MKINGKEITASHFAYDGCHKIYLISTDAEKDDCISTGYDIHPIAKLQKKFEDSCGLRFISYWNLNKKDCVKQFDVAKFQAST